MVADLGAYRRTGAVVTVWTGVALGALQGLTEFLPVSSSGHLVLARALLGLRSPGASLEAWLHLGTLAAVVTAYRRSLGTLARAVRPGGDAATRVARRGLVALGVASLPAAVVGLGGRTALEATFAAPGVVAAGLVATSCVLASLAFAPTGGAAQGAGEVPAPPTVAAVVVGLAQAAALVPGVSRSGATIAAARWLGLGPEQAAAFSFVLSIPAVAGAAALELAGHGASQLVAAPALAGAATAGAVGYAALAVVRRMLVRDRLWLFAPYTLAAAALALSVARP
jgi:undecaprenyl-diphosphatase